MLITQFRRQFTYLLSPLNESFISQELLIFAMLKKAILRTLFILVVFAIYLNVEADPLWRWEERFSSSEKEHLQDCILHAEKGLTTTVWPLPRNQRGIRLVD